MHSFYRISDNSYNKIKLPASKELCLRNFWSCFSEQPVTVIADNCGDQLLNVIYSVCDKSVIETRLNNAGSLIFAIEKALELPDDCVVYFAEDDYVYLNGSTAFGKKEPKKLLHEGLQRADYVTLYDHPDKYNREYQYGETGQVFTTASSHWRYTISTCMTFGTTVGRLREDLSIWQGFTQQHHPHDHDIFVALQAKGRRLAVCIPGVSYHTDLTYPLSCGQGLDLMLDPWVIEAVVGEIEEDEISKTYQGLKKLMYLKAKKAT